MYSKSESQLCSDWNWLVESSNVGLPFARTHWSQRFRNPAYMLATMLSNTLTILDPISMS